MGNKGIAIVELVVGVSLLVVFIGMWAYMGGLLQLHSSHSTEVVQALWEFGGGLLVIGFLVGAMFTDASHRLKKS